jgi:hypothetical protein
MIQAKQVIDVTYGTGRSDLPGSFHYQVAFSGAIGHHFRLLSDKDFRQ